MPAILIIGGYGNTGYYDATSLAMLTTRLNIDWLTWLTGRFFFWSADDSPSTARRNPVAHASIPTKRRRRCFAPRGA